jgi:hypothetical protein
MQRDGAVLSQMKDAGEPLPDWAHEPSTDPIHPFFLSAYFDLDTERAFNGWTVPPIPESKIYEYLRREGLTHRNAKAAAYVIRQMDNAHMQWMRDELATKFPSKNRT